MNVIYKLRNKLEEIINSIDIGETELTKSDAIDILKCIDKCCGSKKLYRGDISYKFDIGVNDIDKYIYVGYLPEPSKDDDGIDFWYASEIDKVKKENFL